MKVEKQVEHLIERFRPFMPSAGTWPFTVMQMKRAEFAGVSIEHTLKAEQQLMFLLRTDFKRVDLLDYIANTEEFDTVPADRQEDFLNEYMQRTEAPHALLNWSERVVSIGIGVAFNLSKDLGLCLEDVQANLSELNEHFDWPKKHLKAYQLFDVSPIKKL
jgi:hypothetical protein